MTPRAFAIRLAVFAGVLAPFSGSTAPMPLIPAPQSVKPRSGSFHFDAGTPIAAASEPAELRVVAEFLAAHLRAATGYSFSIVAAAPDEVTRAIVLRLDPALEGDGKEGYRLVVTRDAATISAAQPPGLFYGVQTFLQLLPAAVERPAVVERPAAVERSAVAEPPAAGESAAAVENRAEAGASAAAGSNLAGTPSPRGIDWSVPCVEIRDEPRFPWRGMHLDVCRHFFPKEFVKKYIDLLASYKMNVFHWHLTEDQGWRIEIKAFPRLTEVGAWRQETMGDCTPHGGFYAQDDVREIVEYARQRFVTIVPEIEMPGHAQAALAAYPQFSCSGGPFEVATTWGVFNDVYCAGNDSTFAFLEAVLDEVTRLFPGPYVHIGGDECPKLRWSRCKRCQDRIRAEGLIGERELQSYFVRRIDRMLAARGKRLVGWDEILEGGLPPNATVMSWRGTQGGIDAATTGHDVVMTPGSHCYFDHAQAREGEPAAWGGFLPLDLVYEYEPVPDALSPERARHVLGAQGNVWSEWMPTTSQVEYMVLPRLCAMSEVLWSERARRDERDFVRRLAPHYDRLVARGLNFRVPTPPGLGGRRYIARDTLVTLENPVPGATVHYTLDGTDPALESPPYWAPFPIRDDATLKTILVLGNGRRSSLVTTRFYRVDRRANGLRYAYYEGEWDSLPDFAGLHPVRTGRTYAVDLDAIPHREEAFGVVLRGQLEIARAGEYTLYLTSDDGSRLSLDGRLLIDNDGLHGAHEASAAVQLTAGRHAIVVEYLERGGDETLELELVGPGLDRQPIPPRSLRPD